MPGLTLTPTRILTLTRTLTVAPSPSLPLYTTRSPTPYTEAAMTLWNEVVDRTIVGLEPKPGDPNPDTQTLVQQ